MQSLKNCDFIIDIEIIESITGGDRSLEVIFFGKGRTKYKLVFSWVWDMRYSIENASIDRFYEFRKYLPEGLIDSSIYKVENSEYIKYFERQVSGTYSVDELQHYVLYDKIDTILDVLTVRKPMLEKA